MGRAPNKTMLMDTVGLLDSGMGRGRSTYCLEDALHA